MQIQVGQGEADDEPARVFGDTAVTNFYEPKDALDYMEGVLDSGAYTRLGAV